MRPLIITTYTKVHTIKGFKEKIEELRLESVKQLKLASMIEENTSISEIVDTSPLKKDETFKFLKFLELSELISIKVRQSDSEDSEDKTVIDPLSDNTVIISEKILNDQIDHELKKTD